MGLNRDTGVGTAVVGLDKINTGTLSGTVFTENIHLKK